MAIQSAGGVVSPATRNGNGKRTSRTEPIAKRQRMKNLVIRNRRIGLQSKDKKNLKLLSMRALVWALFIVIPTAAILLMKIGLYHAFFSGNPHFLIKHIHIFIEAGSITHDHIKNQLKIKPGKENLNSVDLSQLRKQLLRDPLVRDVEIRRILPDTLEIRVHGRTPIAQLLKNGGRLIDADNIILGESHKGDTKKWPIITGIPNIDSFETGKQLDDPMVAKGVEFLRLKDIVRNGHWLDVKIVQLDNSYRELRIYLNGRNDFGIRNNAVIVLPFDGLKDGLYRAMAILEQRIEAKQPTSFIDATYEKRVPVRP